MKQRIRTVSKLSLFALLIAFAVAASSRSVAASNVLDRMRLVAENEHLSLFIDDATTEIAVLDKRTGDLWYSNPPNRDRQRGVASETLRIAYATPNADRVEMDSYNHSVVLGQYTTASIDNGVRVEYRIGDEYKGVKYILPHLISEHRMQEILSRVESESDRRFILDNYVLISLERDPDLPEIEVSETTRPWWKFWQASTQPTVDESDVESVETILFGGHRLVAKDDTLKSRQQAIERLESEIEELLASGAGENSSEVQRLIRDLNRAVSYYENDRAKLIWTLVSKYRGTIVAQYGRVGGRSDVQSINDLTQDDFRALRNTRTYMLNTDTPFYLEDMAHIFAEAGYTIADMYQDHVQYRLEPPIKSLEVFTIPVEYRLEGDSLVVRIPMGEVSYPHEIPTELEFDFDDPDGNVVRYKDDSKRQTFPLYQIDVLRYFGAAGTDKEGYIFVPDGCGALIYLNNGRTDYPIYSEPVYGADRSIPQEQALPYEKQTNCLPVFGLKQGDKAWYAVIEKGDAVANIRADIARTRDSYNVVLASFNTMSRMVVNTGSGRVMTYQPSLYRGDIQIRYFFLKGESASYVGMAKGYRDYLIARYGLERVGEDSLPMFVELVGAVTKVQPVLGVPVRVPAALTTFEDVRTVAGDLLDAGVKNLKIRYSGWLSGGLLHDFPAKAASEQALGTADQFRDLIEFLDKENIGFFPDVCFLKVTTRSSRLEGFSVRKDAARFLSGLIATVSEYDPVTLAQNGVNARYVLSPAALPGLVDRFLESYARYGIDGLSLGDLGSEVNADYHRGRFVDRQQAREIIEEQCKKIGKTAGLDTLFTTGNAYVFPYARCIVDVPTESTNHGLENEAVPFYQIVVHGLFDFAGAPLNSAPDMRKAKLRAIETGSGLYFKWIVCDSSIVKGTDFDYLLNVEYGRWKDKAIAMYREVSEALRPARGHFIDNHEKIADGVYRTTFDNGYTVVVNYNNTSVQVDGLTIDANGYLLGMGGEVR